jgi:hypothetical protein
MEKGAPAPPGHPLADSDEAWFDKFSQGQDPFVLNSISNCFHFI